MKKLIETLKTMSFKEAVDYIWEYYKLHIIGIAVLIFVIVSIITNIVKEDEVYYNAMVVAPVTYDQVNELSVQINQEHFDEFTFSIDNIAYQGGGLSEQSYEQVQKFIARTATGMVDFMITDEAMALDLIEQEGLKPIEDVYTISKLESKGVELLDFGTGTIYGIRASKLDVFSGSDVFRNQIILIPATSKNDDMTKEVFDTLLKD
ncbi:hypothetical protein ACFOZ1_13460 [Gracilibacillus marinus]|jgi:hypothetical protein|uniref:Uncharacterized protein n=1 Tax=Gracilibacillus marinus TaxID=630535 RepID=A0ABV8W004_9BACI